ncbi:hypothetical protein PR048_002718 [Dryococelus australis]|uniref:Uncharacterized protein n=1 Tax=Dryococelus australis TaxID=614101 RepID=A0ABQ9IL39_9NEOP|nr:hypothetical protein PR048_002718 [Dryococelus australis]
MPRLLGTLIGAHGGSHHTEFSKTEVMYNFLNGAAVKKRLEGSLPTEGNWVRFPSGQLADSRMWESCRTMPLVGGLSRRSPHFLRPCIPTLLRIPIASPTLALKTSMFRTSQNSTLHYSLRLPGVDRTISILRPPRGQSLIMVWSAGVWVTQNEIEFLDAGGVACEHTWLKDGTPVLCEATNPGLMPVRF